MKRLFIVNVYRKKEKVKGYLEALFPIFQGEIKILDEKNLKQVNGPAIVTGSEKMVGQGEVSEALLEFIRETPWPLLGICYGHQAIAKAFGHRVGNCGKHKGMEAIIKLKDSPLLQGLAPAFQMEESHYECVDGKGPLDIVAVNRARPEIVEVLQHPQRVIFGVQFHPERTPDGRNFVLRNFLSLSFKK